MGTVLFYFKATEDFNFYEQVVQLCVEFANYYFGFSLRKFVTMLKILLSTALFNYVVLKLTAAVSVYVLRLTGAVLNQRLV